MLTQCEMKKSVRVREREKEKEREFNAHRGESQFVAHLSQSGFFGPFYHCKCPLGVCGVQVL